MYNRKGQHIVYVKHLLICYCFIFRYYFHPTRRPLLFHRRIPLLSTFQLENRTALLLRSSQTFSKETISVTIAHSVALVCCLSLCDVSLLSPLLSGGSSMTLRCPSLDEAAQLSWQPNAVSAPIWFALSAIMCGTGLFNTVNYSVVLLSTDIPEIWMRRAW